MKILLYYVRILTNLFINVNNKILTTNFEYYQVLQTVKVWVLEKMKTLKHDDLSSVNQEICFLEALQFTNESILAIIVNKNKIKLILNYYLSEQ